MSTYPICSTHFTGNWFITSGNKRLLKPISIPTQFAHRKVTAVVTAQESGPNILPAKRRRIDEDDPIPSTLSSVVQIIS